MDESHAELLTDILEDVVQSGTGKRAAIPGREIAGKTGTTDNYGDAWFVGYTPELVVAVWVGYPDALKPMLTEFNGEPVAGGTLPAMIWKAFVEKVDEDEDRVVRRSALPRWGLDVGRAARRRVAARQRLLPRRAARRVLLRARARHGGRLQAERGVRAARRRDDRRPEPRRRSLRSRSRRRSRTHPRRRAGSRASSSTRIRGEAGSRRTTTVTICRREGASTGIASELRRLEPRRRAARGDAAEDPSRREDRPGPRGHRAAAGARSRESRSRPGMRVRLVVGDGSRT